MDWLSPLREIFEFLFPFFDRIPVIRAILGFVFILFLPGFAWTLVFFRQISNLERVSLSFALSIAVITLSLLFANLLIGVSITGINSALIILLVTILPLAIYYLNWLIKRRRGKAT
jgi:uncharacterized membrane protein